MELGLNLRINRILSLRGIFIVVRSISKIWSKKKCYYIDSIKLKDQEYFVSFYYPGERLIFVKSATEILKSVELINKFSSRDALIIGFCVSNPSSEQFKRVKFKNK